MRKGEIHAFMGENGAGKSTLMNILAGLLEKDAGKIVFEGKEIEKMTPELATELGIGFVHQELNLAEDVSVAENVFIGRLPYTNDFLGIVNFKKLYEDTAYWLNMVGAKVNPTALVGSLSTANKQLIEIAKALSLNAKVIIFDEPTTSLSDKDVEVLFIIIRRLKEKGFSSIYISHRMKEIFELGERITHHARWRVHCDGPCKEFNRRPNYLDAGWTGNKGFISKTAYKSWRSLLTG